MGKKKEKFKFLSNITRIDIEKSYNLELQESFIPKIKIQEGHNIILLNDNSKNYYFNNLPNEIFNFLEDSFQSLYSYSNCADKTNRCWRSWRGICYNNSWCSTC